MPLSTDLFDYPLPPELIAQARALDAYASGDLPAQYVKMRASMAKEAIKTVTRNAGRPARSAAASSSTAIHSEQKASPVIGARLVPLQQPSAPLRSKIIAALRNAIETGVLVPGQRLIEKDLCEQLGVSRTSLREALRPASLSRRPRRS